MEENVQTPEVNPVIEQARSMGWKPKEEYEGDPEKWVNADIFVARAPLFEKIDEQHRYAKNLQRRLEQMEKVVQEQAAHTERVRQTEYKRALQELREAKRAALAEEDLIRADELQEKIEDLKEVQKTATVSRPDPTPPEAFVQWSSENQWYKLDSEMREFADAIGVVESQKGKSPEEVLKAVTEKVRKHFPDKFRNPNKDRAPSVESQSTGGGVKKGSKFQPTAEQRAIAKRFADSGVMTEEQYYKDLQAMQELE